MRTSNKLGVSGVTPQDPFVNDIMVILVNFLDFVIFSLLFLSFFFRSAFFFFFFGGGGEVRTPSHTPAYAPWQSYYNNT